MYQLMVHKSRLVYTGHTVCHAQPLFSLYVDDFLICYRSKYIHIIERHLQWCLNKLQVGLTPTAKTVCIHRPYHTACWV